MFSDELSDSRWLQLVSRAHPTFIRAVKTTRRALEPQTDLRVGRQLYAAHKTTPSAFAQDLQVLSTI